MHSLGTSKIAVLPALHVLSGADNTGSVARKGKATWWKAFQEASQDVITALTNLGANEPPSAKTMAANVDLQAVGTEHDYCYCQSSAMVAFQKEEGSDQETSVNASCPSAYCYESQLLSNGLE